eukprot:m.1096249 g.1096249  ORF g.1096249 m.1096249 type:complete len:1347 (+) comp24308_c0_seq1:348-4388(+)
MAQSRDKSSIQVIGDSTRRLSGLDSKTFAILLAAEADAKNRRAVGCSASDSEGKTKENSGNGRRGSKTSSSVRRRSFSKSKRPSGSNLREKISMVKESFRNVGGVLEVKKEEDGSTCSILDLVKAKGETTGIYLRQGDGFDRDSGIFVSRLEMGSAAEMMGLHMGDEVLTVNNVDVTDGEIDWVEMLMKVVDIVVLKVRTRPTRMTIQQLQASTSSATDDPPADARATGLSVGGVDFDLEYDEYPNQERDGPEESGDHNMESRDHDEESENDYVENEEVSDASAVSPVHGLAGLLDGMIAMTEDVGVAAAPPQHPVTVAQPPSPVAQHPVTDLDHSALYYDADDGRKDEKSHGQDHDAFFADGHGVGFYLGDQSMGTDAAEEAPGFSGRLSDPGEITEEQWDVQSQEGSQSSAASSQQSATSSLPSEPDSITVETTFANTRANATSAFLRHAIDLDPRTSPRHRGNHGSPRRSVQFNLPPPEHPPTLSSVVTATPYRARGTEGGGVARGAATNDYGATHSPVRSRFGSTTSVSPGGSRGTTSGVSSSRRHSVGAYGDLASDAMGGVHGGHHWHHGNSVDDARVSPDLVVRGVALGRHASRTTEGSDAYGNSGGIRDYRAPRDYHASSSAPTHDPLLSQLDQLLAQAHAKREHRTNENAAPARSGDVARTAPVRRAVSLNSGASVAVQPPSRRFSSGLEYDSLHEHIVMQQALLRERAEIEPVAPAASGYDAAGSRVGAPPGSPARPRVQVPRADGLPPTSGATKRVCVERASATTSLGITIAGGADTALGALFVAQVVAGGATDVDGRIWAGDRLLHIDDVATDGMTQQDLIDVIKGNHNTEVAFGIQRIGDDQWADLQRLAGIRQLRFNTDAGDATPPPSSPTGTAAPTSPFPQPAWQHEADGGEHHGTVGAGNGSVGAGNGTVGNVDGHGGRPTTVHPVVDGGRSHAHLSALLRFQPTPADPGVSAGPDDNGASEQMHDRNEPTASAPPPHATPPHATPPRTAPPARSSPSASTVASPPPVGTPRAVSRDDSDDATSLPSLDPPTPPGGTSVSSSENTSPHDAPRPSRSDDTTSTQHDGDVESDYNSESALTPPPLPACSPPASPTASPQARRKLPQLEPTPLRAYLAAADAEEANNKQVNNDTDTVADTREDANAHVDGAEIRPSASNRRTSTSRTRMKEYLAGQQAEIQRVALLNQKRRMQQVRAREAAKISQRRQSLVLEGKRATVQNAEIERLERLKSEEMTKNQQVRAEADTVAAEAKRVQAAVSPVSTTNRRISARSSSLRQQFLGKSSPHSSPGSVRRQSPMSSPGSGRRQLPKPPVLGPGTAVGAPPKSEEADEFV